MSTNSCPELFGFMSLDLPEMLSLRLETAMKGKNYTLSRNDDDSPSTNERPARSNGNQGDEELIGLSSRARHDTTAWHHHTGTSNRSEGYTVRKYLQINNGVPREIWTRSAAHARAMVRAARPIKAWPSWRIGATQAESHRNRPRTWQRED